MISTRSMERMTEADQEMLLLSLQREMAEMKRMTEEVVQKNEQEMQAFRRENEEEADGGGTVHWVEQCFWQVLHLPCPPETGGGDERQGSHPRDGWRILP